MSSPYSSARLGNVAACDCSASCWNCGHVFAVASGMRASTTRAPSRSRSATQASAASLRSVSRPSPIPGGWRRSPTVSPSRRGAGTGRWVSTDHMSATSSTLRAIGPTVSSVGTSGNTPSFGIRPHCDLSPTTSQAADGRRIEQPVSEPERELAEPRSERGGGAGRRAARRLAPDASGCGTCRTTRSGRGRPRRTRAGASCRRGRRRRRAAAGRRSRSARGRGPRRGPSRRSCGSRPCRRDP